MPNQTLNSLLFLCLFLGLSTLQHPLFAQCPNLVWADEFSGTSLDQAKWNYQIGDGCDIGICGWGNNELQSYQQGNVAVSNGQLQITARKERTRGSQYTSGRINTKGKADFTYGRFEASIKLPYGDGLWPAFWMLSTDEVYGGWPQSGEIDIMEFVASNPGQTLGYIHYGDPYPNNQSQGTTYRLGDGNFPDAFHEFAVEWEPGEIRWFVDGVLFSRKTAADVAPYQWPFDQNFHFLLNVAVGGNLGGPVDNGMLPATMAVDYVRVYDGFRAYLTGDRVVANQAQGITYRLENLSAGTNVSWAVPAGATIISGQGSAEITVDFGDASGHISASYHDGCQTRETGMFVEVEPAYSRSFSFENFDEPATAVYASSTGTLTEVNTPAPNATNSSARAGKYDRNGAEQYDVLVYNVSNLTDASAYTDKTKKFYLDVHTTAPVGTDIILQLETAAATPTNFPTGRHSRYVATVGKNGQWHRLAFQPLDRPDAGAADADVSKMILLFASNSFTADTYYFDNLDSYASGGGGGGGGTSTATAVHVSALSTGSVGAGKGSKAGTATVTITDDLGNAVSGAVVSGTFNGTFNESATGTTDAAGKVVLTTQATTKGGATVGFCVDQVTASLPYDPAANTATCATAVAMKTTEPAAVATPDFGTQLSVFPNPARDFVRVSLAGRGGLARVWVYDAAGRLVLERDAAASTTIQLSTSDLPAGTYRLRATTGEGEVFISNFVK
ncbi:family 16 glycosylhydrolase [Neolewinella litorea]|uniref:Glycosyl hydrolase family protein n=1 Tax=Neolewinella litorea TaxID=2562452 RepID=A0A4S4NJP9_9BACT|nr:family 16 glycosylhydrolase [Neolewinella litorea]THH40034.1 glycosyl hydrolase family protein [Neolewinella litorea]